MAKRGALDIISITWKWIQSHLLPTVNRLILWSDNCSAQNKNWMFFFFIAWLIYTDRCKCIDLKFLLKGHSFMLPDSVFGRIQNSAKHFDIEVPSQWKEVMTDASTVPNEVLSAEFLDLVPLLRGIFTIRHADVDGGRIDKITTYAWYRFQKNETGEVLMMLRKEIKEDIAWKILKIEKLKGQVEHNIDDMNRPYCELGK